MMDGVATLVPVQVRPESGAILGLLPGEEGVDDGLGVRAIDGGDGNLHTVASGKDHRFGNAVKGLQIIERIGQRVFAERQAFPDFDRGGFVADSREVQLHWLSNMELSRAWAAQVSMAK